MKKLVVVDDEPEICDFLSSFFEERGFDVRTAGSGDEAVRVVGEFQPHLVLLDVQMPGMNGISALRQIKQKHPSVKVIMVTAVETKEKIEEALRSGADNYITKPLSLEYLEKDVQEKVAHLTSGD